MDRAKRNGADWLIPAARVNMKREFLLPLSDVALKVLEALPAIGDEGPALHSRQRGSGR